MKTHIIFLWILIFVVIDQTIKIIINMYFLDSTFNIIPSLLEFKPVFNQKHSYINVLLNDKLGLNMGLFLHLVIFLFVAVLITVVYDFYRSIIDSKMLDFAFILFMSALFCALIGNLIWTKGVLDYLHLKPLSVIFDLKDMYVDLFIILFFLGLNKDKAKVKSVKTRDLILHVKSRLRKTIS